jgi:hypothetical protein
MGRAAKVIAVVRFAEPTALAGSLAGLSARRLGTVVLALGAARVRIKEGPTVLALAFAAWTSHEPASPQAHNLQIAAETEEHGAKSGPKTIEEDGRRGEICHVGKKMAQPTRPVHPDGLSTVSGHR